MFAQPATVSERHARKVRASGADALSRTAIRAIEQAEAKLGRFDHVTRLPNRVSFLDDFPVLRERQADPALVLVTLADARHYNELLRALGHQYAEDFVRAGAKRLADLLGNAVPIYQVSVLSFAFVGSDQGAGAPGDVIAAIVAAFLKPILCQDIPVNAKTGVGIRPLSDKVVDAKAVDASELLRSALAAAQDSRRSFAGWARYDRQNDEAHLRAFRLLTDLPAAFTDAGQLSLAYQPRVSMRDRACVSAEALLRWTHPTLGAVSPGEFIPLAENTALITPLTQWVVEQSMQTVRSWQPLKFGLKISVNISPKNLEEPDFVNMLRFSAEKYDVDPGLVEMEFTEGALAASTSLVLSQLAQIRASGFEIAIDDFGSGYSNMSYLGRIPARFLKIDQSFIRPLAADARNQVLVQSIIAMAHSLGYEVVAEGIESGDAFDMLAGWACDEGQGYFMSRPLTDDRFRAWIAAA